MLVLNIPVFISTLFVQVTTINFPGGTFLTYFSGRGLGLQMMTIRPWQLWHESFYKLGLLFLMEMARYVQSTHCRNI